jgi:TMEM175 potassium channel family protein
MDAHQERAAVHHSIWLFCIVSLPFPTELIGRSAGQGSVGNGLYIGTMLVASAAGLAGHWVLLHAPNLVNESALDQLSLEPSVSTTITMAVAFVIAIAFPSIGLWALLLLIPSNEFDRRYMRDRRQRIAQP